MCFLSDEYIMYIIFTTHACVINVALKQNMRIINFFHRNINYYVENVKMWPFQALRNCQSGFSPLMM